MPQEGLEPPTYALRSKKLYCFYISNWIIFYVTFQFMVAVGFVLLMLPTRINVRIRLSARFTQSNNCNHGVTPSLS